MRDELAAKDAQLASLAEAAAAAPKLQVRPGGIVCLSTLHGHLCIPVVEHLA